jgi:hypothetical protein
MAIHLGRRSYGNVPFSLYPSLLFSNSEVGVWYDTSDLSTLFQDSAGINPVTAVGQSVALIRDKSGNNKDALLTNATLRRTRDGSVLHSVHKWRRFDHQFWHCIGCGMFCGVFAA